MSGTGAIILLGAGALAIYLGVSGNLDSFWRGVRGECGGSLSESSEPATAGDVYRVGQYYPTPTGSLYVSDTGLY